MHIIPPALDLMCMCRAASRSSPEREREKEKNPTSLKIFCSSSIEGLFPSALRRVPKSLVVMEPCGGDAPVCERTHRESNRRHMACETTVRSTFTEPRAQYKLEYLSLLRHVLLLIFGFPSPPPSLSSLSLSPSLLSANVDHPHRQ